MVKVLGLIAVDETSFYGLCLFKVLFFQTTSDNLAQSTATICAISLVFDIIKGTDGTEIQTFYPS